MDVEVCHATAFGATRVTVSLESGATVADAVLESGLVATLALDLAGLSFAVFGRRATATTVLHEGDRVELLRPLVVDPKAARHRRIARKRASG